MNADAVTNGKVHVPPVEHRHGLLFVGLSLVPEGNALLKDWRTVGRFNREFWLEDPCFVAAFLRLALFVDEKKRHRPGTFRPSHDTFDHHVGLFLSLRTPGHERSLFQGKDMRCSTHWLPLPHSLGCSLWGFEVIAVFAFVRAPTRFDAQTGSRIDDTETHANGRGEETRDLQCCVIIKPVFNAA